MKQTRSIYLKADIAISCFNCKHCVDKNDDEDTYICNISNKQIGDADTDLTSLLQCENGKDWTLDKKVALDFMSADISNYKIFDETLN
jgi:hypothetical protein